MYILADPDAFEEDLCESVVSVAVGAKGRIVRLEGVGAGLGLQEMKLMVQAAEERRREALGVLGAGG